jgi:hypothetical protein
MTSFLFCVGAKGGNFFINYPKLDVKWEENQIQPRLHSLWFWEWPKFKNNK